MFSDRKEHVEDLIIEGICDNCDQDPTKCYNQGFCQYEKECEQKALEEVR